MRVALPGAVLARSKPYRRSLLKDQGHPTQSRGPHARGPGRSAGSCALIGYRTRRTGLLRTLRLQYTGSIVMTNAVSMREDTETANPYCTRPGLCSPHDVAGPRVAPKGSPHTSFCAPLAHTPPKCCGCPKRPCTDGSAWSTVRV